MCFLLAAIHTFVSLCCVPFLFTRTQDCVGTDWASWSKARTIWQITGKRKGFEHFSSKSMHLAEEFLWVYSSVACIELIFIAQRNMHIFQPNFFSKQNHETIRNETTHQIARWKEKCAKFPVCISICPVVADVLHFQAQANECNIFACLNLWISYVIDVWMTKYTSKIHVIINLWERRWWWCARQMEIKPKVDWMFDGNAICMYKHNIRTYVFCKRLQH